MQRVEFADGAGRQLERGGLRVQTEPTHLPVIVDGKPTAYHRWPSTSSSLASTRSRSGPAAASLRAVSIQPRETLSLIVSSAAPASDGSVAAGWMSVSSPVPLQLREGGKVIGTSESDRLMLTAGDHDIEFANEALGFTVRRRSSHGRQDRGDENRSAERRAEHQCAAVGGSLRRRRARR